MTNDFNHLKSNTHIDVIARNQYSYNCMITGNRNVIGYVYELDEIMTITFFMITFEYITKLEILEEELIYCNE